MRTCIEILVFLCVIFVIVLLEINSEKKQEKQRQLADKHLLLYLLMNKWVEYKQEGKNISHYLELQGYNTIAIYGMNYVGETLLRELRGTDIKVAYAIDKDASYINADCEIYSPYEDVERVDALIVTPIFYYEQIKREMSIKMSCPIISIEEIILNDGK